MLTRRSRALFFFSKTLLAFLALVTVAEAREEPSWSDRVARYDQHNDFGSLFSGGAVEPNWLEDGHSFWYSTTSSDLGRFVLVDSRSGSRRAFFNEERLLGQLRRKLGEELIEALPFDEFTLEDGEKVAHFEVGERDFRLDLETYDLTEELADDVHAETEIPSPDGRWHMFVRGHDLHARDLASGETKQLTADGMKDYPWTLDEINWSTAGDRVAVTRYDQRGLHKMPVVKWLPDQEEVEWVSYPFAREPDARTEIHIIDLARKTVTAVGQGDGGYQFVLDWRDDDRELLALRFGAGMRSLSLIAINPQTGRNRTLVLDEQETFIEGLHISLSLGGFYFPLLDGERFIWRSDRDGWTHFYLYNYDGRLIRRLTKGEYEVLTVLAVDDEAETIYFTATADLDHPYDQHLYQVRLDGTEMTVLTDGVGTHAVTLSPDATYFVDNHSSPTRPPVAELRHASGELVLVLERADVSGLNAIGWRPPEEFVVKAADGKTDLHGLLYKPHDFDPTRTYPVIELIYGGSWAPAVPRRFMPGETSGLAQALAQLNFITFLVDGRGTPGRGKAFQDVIYGQIGRHEIPDHVATLRQLAAVRPYMDLGRVGIHGKSWGGYFALRAMLQAPDTFHVGVASGIVADLSTTMSSPVAPYMGIAGENEEGYAEASCLTMADRLEGKLLITIATADVNTPFAQTLRMVEAFIQAGKPIDLMLFPDQHHWLQGESMTYFYAMLRRYFVEHLRPSGRPSTAKP